MLVLATVAGVAAPARAAVVHSIDDGSANQTAGFTSGTGQPASFIFINAFAADPLGERISSIAISYGMSGFEAGSRAGTPVRLLLMRDRLGAAVPNDLELLAFADTTVRNIATNTFNDIAIPQTIVVGNFFVGVQASQVPVDAAYPISIDQTTPRQKSFAAFFSGAIAGDQVNSTGYDAAQTTDSPGTVDTGNFVNLTTGNFMIRATGTPVPEPAALGLLCLGGLLARRRRR